MDGTSGAVGGKVVETHGLVDDALTCESGVTVEEDAHCDVVG